LVLTPGTRLGPYEVTAQIGVGGMGEVYRAHDSQLGRDVAIKVLPLELANDPDRLSRFDREARALAALNHPNIATIHGIAQTAEAASSGQASAVRAIVLELVEGPTLSERLARGPVPLDEALAIARQIAEALDTAHEKGIVHRDLKPSNIKIRPDGRVKVLDFGLAKLVNQVDGTSGLDGTEQLTVAATQPGLVMGTAAYMSPEQARGTLVDKRTDIWAFGCILYEMLAARPAFSGATTADTMASVLEREPDWGAMPPHTPADVMSLVHLCLDKDVRHRLRDIGDSQRALSGTGNVWQSTPVERLASPRRALPWIAAAAALAAAAMGVWFLRPSAPAGPVQATHFQITIPDHGNIAAGASNTLAVAPDGRKIAMVVEVNQKTGIWVKALEESAARPVPGSDGAQYVLWSPDSKSLAFRVLDKLLRFDLASSAPVVITPMPVGPNFGANWGGDGTSAGSILFNGALGIMRVPGSGGEPVAIDVTDGFHPQMLPGGRFFYTSGRKAAVLGAPLDHPAASVQILKEDAAPVYAPRAGEIGRRDGFLLWIRGTTLLAQAFDPNSMRLAGEPTVLADPAWTVAVSSSVLLYDPAPAMSQFAWVDRNGKVLQLVGDPAPFGFTAMSPDGSRVVVTVTTNGGIAASALWMLDTRRGVLNPFVAEMGPNTSPVWSPDGQTILFGSSKGLTRIATSGVGDPDVVHPFPRRINPTDWSRRGFVLFNQFGLGIEMDPSTEMNIMVLPVTPDGQRVGEARPYLQKPGTQRSGRFSPDGGWVVYEESSQSRQSDVFIDTFPERHGAIQISSNGGFDGHWNPQGGEVFYRSLAGKLMAVSLKMDKTAADASAPRELFTLPVTALAGTGSQYDVAQDGDRFLIQVAVKKAPLELITNWQGLLK
jgi:eukaryotic-like serine/threonine-protein kinase